MKKMNKHIRKFALTRPGWPMAFTFIAYGVALVWITGSPLYDEPGMIFKTLNEDLNLENRYVLPIFTIFMGFVSAINDNHRLNFITAGLLISFSIYGLTKIDAELNASALLSLSVYAGAGFAAIQSAMLSRVILEIESEIQQIKEHQIDRFVKRRYNGSEDIIISGDISSK